MTNNREYIGHLMRKATDSIATARSIENLDFAVSRAYYGMFYAAEAMLLTKGLQYKRHSAVIANFNREFVKTGVFYKGCVTSAGQGFRFQDAG